MFMKSMAFVPGGQLNFDSAKLNIGWAGIGQFEDQVNPLAMMVYRRDRRQKESSRSRCCCAAARCSKKGKRCSTRRAGAPAPERSSCWRLAARQISDMMRNNVKAITATAIIRAFPACQDRYSRGRQGQETAQLVCRLQRGLCLRRLPRKQRLRRDGRDPPRTRCCRP